MKPLLSRVALVTGSSRGLGREFALALAEAGARVVVNGSHSTEDAQEVVERIRREGGEAICEMASVSDGDAVKRMVARTHEQWGQVDILVNNAGFTIDKTFAKSSIEDFQRVLDVHVGGAARCSHAVWPHMLEQGYGRIIMISSASGLAGNFGQAAYGAAKMAMIGLMNTLGLEGQHKGIRVNSFAPIGITNLNRDIIDPALHSVFDASKLAPGIVLLSSEEAPNQCLLTGGAGAFERIYFTMTRGVAAASFEELRDRFDELSSRDQEEVFKEVRQQMESELKKAVS